MSRNKKPFLFKQFRIFHDECAMKVGTDGVLIGAWTDVIDAKSVLDIGTGTGLIAIMMAQKNSIANIDAIDIDNDAYHQALKNVDFCPWKDRISIYHKSIQDFIDEKSATKYNAIVCNPPFFNAGTASKVSNRQIARHTNTLSYDDLIDAVCELLAKDGKFSLILPRLEGIEFQEIAKTKGLYLARLTEVQSKKEKPVERLLMEFQREEKQMVKSQLIIQYESRNDWTPDYIALTKAFYLKM